MQDAIQIANIADLVTDHTLICQETFVSISIFRINRIDRVLLFFPPQYFRTLNTRVSVVYLETWVGDNQALVDKQDIHRALLNFNDYVSRKLYAVDKDTTQLLS